MSHRDYFLYILSNISRSVLYVGVTNNLILRVFEHKSDFVRGFTQKYKVHYLIYYEVLDNPMSAIEREKQLKSWSRKRKDDLIRKLNPNLDDLYEKIKN